MIIELDNNRNTCEPIYDTFVNAFVTRKPIVFHSSSKPPVNSRPIEKISHHIWLRSHSGKNNNHEVNAEHFQSLLTQYDKMDQDNPDFKHIFWTNDKTLIPNTVQTLQRLGNVEIRTIDSLQSDIPRLDLIQDKLESGIYGVAIDAIKYEVLRIFGGIVLDLNFNITTNNNLSQVLDSYSFIASGNLDGRKVTFENSIIAASKGHPILKEACEMIGENLHEDSLIKRFTQEYHQWKNFSSMKQNNAAITDEFYRMFSVAVLNNLDPYNKEAPEEIFNKEGRANSPQEELIGIDYHADSWKE